MSRSHIPLAIFAVGHTKTSVPLIKRSISTAAGEYDEKEPVNTGSDAVVIKIVRNLMAWQSRAQRPTSYFRAAVAFPLPTFLTAGFLVEFSVGGFGTTGMAAMEGSGGSSTSAFHAIWAATPRK